MKKALLTSALASSLTLAVAPDFSDVHSSGFNQHATKATLFNDEEMVNIQEYITKGNGHPDTIYAKAFNSISGPEDTMRYYMTFEYNEPENYYNRIMYFPSFIDEGMDTPFISKMSYNNKGLTTSCTTFVYFMSTQDTSVAEYLYDEHDRLIKKVRTAVADSYTEPDSVRYSYNEDNLVKSCIEYYSESGDQGEPSTTESSYTYEDKKLTEILTITYDKSGAYKEKKRIEYTLNTSPVLQQHIQRDGRSHRISLQQGRLLNLGNSAETTFQLLSPSGRLVKELSVTSSGSIIQWNSIPNGYYLLQITQNNSVVTLPFIK